MPEVGGLGLDGETLNFPFSPLTPPACMGMTPILWDIEEY